MLRPWTHAIWMAFCICVAFASTHKLCRAEFTVIGPLPYLSRDDSPFPVDGSNLNFFLEDFEDGELNTPGITQRNLFPLMGDAALGVIMPPGADTDSVDADDGSIDGLGLSGHSFRTTLDLVLDLFPPIHSFETGFDFDRDVLGFYPTAFGLVWTDGPPNSSFSLQITTPLGNTFNSEAIAGLGDNDRQGRTDEDFFIGVVAKDGIARVRIRGGFWGELTASTFIEVDHLQYGLIVPEPASISHALTLVFILFVVRTNSSPALLEKRR